MEWGFEEKRYVGLDDLERARGYMERCEEIREIWV